MSLPKQDPSAWFAATKLHPPLLRHETLRRPQLEFKLCHFIKTLPLTLLSAPAGYGKTTLLSALPSLMPDHELAWIALDQEDNDPIRFIGLLLTSLQRLQPDCGRSLWPLISGGEISASGLNFAIGILLNDIIGCFPKPLILVLDDLHLVSEAVIHSALDYLLEHLPQTVHLVISTRHDPPLRLTRLAVRRQLGELRRVDLGFNISESDQLLNEKLKLRLNTDDIAVLQDRTEGWPGILGLLAAPLARMHSSENRSLLMESISHTERQVSNYLAEEILLDLPVDLRRFLLQTSILVEMTASSCEAVTSRTDAGDVLELLYRRNLAIAYIKTGAESEAVYRYHALFAELLQIQLQKDFTKEEIITLHHRAALVQTTAGRAIAHYLAACSWNLAAELMVRSGTELLYRGMAETIRQWYNGLPDEMRGNYAHLTILMARCEIHRGEYKHAEDLLKQARLMMRRSGDAAGEGDALTSLITLSYHKNDRVAATRYVERASKLPMSAMGEVAGKLAMAWINMYEGHYDLICGNIKEGLAIPRESGDRRADLVGITYLTAPMMAIPGCLQLLERYCDEVVSLAQPDTAWSLGAQELGTWPLLLQGRIKEAKVRAESAARLRQQLGGFPFVGRDIPILLATIYLAEGDIAAANQSIDQLVLTTNKDDLNSKGADMFYLHAAGRLLAQSGRIDEASEMSDRLEKLDRSYPLSEYFHLHLLGLLAYLTGDLVHAEEVLGRAMQLECKLPMAHIGGSAALLQARILLDQGKIEQALTLSTPILAAWNVAGTAGYLLLDGLSIFPVFEAQRRRKGFVFTQMAALMAEVNQDASSSFNRLSKNGTVIAEVAEQLTAREYDVLKLLIAGYGNHQISEELYISHETVKTHVSHIFRKLDVHTRAQAVIRAQELDI